MIIKIFNTVYLLLNLQHLRAFVRLFLRFGPRRAIGAGLASLRLTQHQLLMRSLGAKGVVHVGANLGNERFQYNFLGVRVLWIEADPDVFQLLRRNIASFQNQSALNWCLGDVHCKAVNFYRANNNGLSSSILMMGKGHKLMFPEVEQGDMISVEQRILSDLEKFREFNSNDFDTLVLDVQGSELKVLVGAGDFIRRFSTVIIEAADFRAYEGAHLRDEIELFMSGVDFSLYSVSLLKSLPNVGSYFDLLFIRNGTGHFSSPVIGKKIYL